MPHLLTFLVPRSLALMRRRHRFGAPISVSLLRKRTRVLLPQGFALLAKSDNSLVGPTPDVVQTQRGEGKTGIQPCSSP
ncbi:uncharacterized protein LOC144004204 isoform X3 [Festucalex cinctus]